jgi:hypothetical protein
MALESLAMTTAMAGALSIYMGIGGNEMENRPTIRIHALRIQTEYGERYRKWLTEVYHPLMITVKGCMGVDSYKILKENTQ